MMQPSPLSHMNSGAPRTLRIDGLVGRVTFESNAMVTAHRAWTATGTDHRGLFRVGFRVPRISPDSEGPTV